MRALYDIDQAILDCVDMETGEILDSDRLTALQMEREAKLEGVALWVKDLKAEADAVKAEADKLTARKKALESQSLVPHGQFEKNDSSHICFRNLHEIKSVKALYKLQKACVQT